MELSSRFALNKSLKRTYADKWRMSTFIPFFKPKAQEQHQQYISLSKNHIRLLKLLPGAEEDRIVCTLHAVDLLAYDDIGVEAPIEGLQWYEAISYVWGDAFNLVEIECK